MRNSSSTVPNATETTTKNGRTKKTASQTGPGSVNDGQYQRGYRTPVALPASAPRPRRRGVASVPLATGLDLAPGVEPERVGLGRQLALEVPEREVLLAEHGGRELLGDDALVDQAFRA